jgi:CRP-like cAMP-binding protein
MASKLKALYRRNDPVTSAYLVGKGPVHIGIDGLDRHSIVESSLLVGTVEYFLNESQPLTESRLFNLMVYEDDDLSTVTFDSLEKIILEYDFGFKANVFLAHTLEISNQLHTQAISRLSKKLRKYKVRAIHYARLVDDVTQLASMPQLSGLAKIIEAAKDSFIYHDGELFSREHRSRAIRSIPNPLTQMIHGYKKNAEICSEGAEADSMYVLLEGKVEVRTTDAYISSIEQTGEAFGEATLFRPGGRSATLIAAEDSKLYIVKYDDLGRFYRRHRDVFVNIARTLATRISNNIHRAERYVDITSTEEHREDIEQQSWQELRNLHKMLLDAQKVLKSDTFAQVLSHHSVV